ncbi:riboflavin biosynthesis protein RibF [Lamprobacter modestohalophilus]|uniref:Riboflavin biosynthesis protein n=1 Tax=Lamprobacter modestohalophilus TaxID=1064514 RepID=A0A9X0W7E5_9GAMM|nr:bifunctional riboflavin kinase/FAD synthetase [Lamprobacter modestohalophilus]MBK1617613.1 riboflavin biosynthesis protein RibF [Lamprobacter modestohalophilus]
MRLIRGLHNLRDQDRGCVATIGNFDGVHLGHRAVFQRLLAQGEALGLPATVITFEPQPMEYFAPAVAPARLTRLREKVAAIADDGIERILLLEFGPRLAEMDAHDFIQQVLVDGLGVRFLLVGDDFRFGHNRSGDYALLERVGAELPPEQRFEVANLKTITHADERISSTRIRELLAAGDFEQARQLLGRPYRICGRVGHGDQRGRTIGFPTANIELHRRISPLRGVYAVWVQGVADDPWPGVANIGRRPTLAGTDERLEVHLFDFDGDLYGAHLQVEFALRLRDEQRFNSFEALRAQIERDAESARAWLVDASRQSSTQLPLPERHKPSDIVQHAFGPKQGIDLGERKRFGLDGPASPDSER